MFVVAALFTLACAYAGGLGAFPSPEIPRVIRLGLGSVLLSTVIFLLLLCGLATMPVFVATGVVFLAAGALRIRRLSLSRGPLFGPWWLLIPFAIYAAMYLVQAMVPETQPDAVVYHLGLVAEYSRLHSFPARIGFYEMIPQGMEMLYTMAYSLGGGPAAKLVHFAFLLATFPLMLAIGRSLQLPTFGSYLASLLYFVMPVAGIAGTSTYNDAALVFFTLAAFHCGLQWYRSRSTDTLIALGLLAGCCYAIKVTGLPIVAAVLIWVAMLAKKPMTVLLLTVFATAAMAPWILRALVLTGNPFAPLLNAWFPNAFFNEAAESQMASQLSAHLQVAWRDAAWDYAMRGGLQGIVGPVFFVLPVAFLAIRKKTGQLLLLCAAVAGSPWVLNSGTRFLMPAIPFLALALASVVPLSVLASVTALQLLLCWPPILQRFEGPHAWALDEVPWKAALRIEPEDQYLDRKIGEYSVARMIENVTPPNDSTFCLTSPAKAYTTRNVPVYWHSTPNQELGEALQVALERPPMIEASASFPATQYAGVRLVTRADSSADLHVYEVRCSLNGEALLASSKWQVMASPNSSEAPLAFDRNPATSWRSRGSIEKGMFIALQFDEQPMTLDRIAVTLSAAVSSSALLLQTQDKQDGPWKTVTDALRTTRLPQIDLRRDATHALRRAGYRFILGRAGTTGMDRVSEDMARHPAEWGLLDRGEFTPVHLFEIQ